MEINIDIVMTMVTMTIMMRTMMSIFSDRVFSENSQRSENSQKSENSQRNEK